MALRTALAFLAPVPPFHCRHAPVIAPVSGPRRLSQRCWTAVLRFRYRNVASTRPVMGETISAGNEKVKGQTTGRRKGADKKGKEEKKKGKTKDLVVVKRTGFNSAVVISGPLQEFVGEEMMTRSRLLKVLRSYIREKNLYVGGTRRMFECDEMLERVLGTRGRYRMAQLVRLVMPHVRNPRGMGERYERRARELYEEYLRHKGAVDRSEAKKMDRRGMNSRKTQKELREKGMGMFTEVELAPCLRGICGGRERMSRPQVVKTVWQYIKDKGLQDPMNRRSIRVSDELREGLRIRDRDEVDCFEVSAYVCRLVGQGKEGEGGGANEK